MIETLNHNNIISNVKKKTIVSENDRILIEKEVVEEVVPYWKQVVLEIGIRTESSIRVMENKQNFFYTNKNEKDDENRKYSSGDEQLLHNKYDIDLREKKGTDERWNEGNKENIEEKDFVSEEEEVEEVWEEVEEEEEDVLCKCGGDDWNCYSAAQQELLYLLTQTGKGCSVVLTGDYHWSDIKVR